MADDFAAVRKWADNLERIVSGEALERMLNKAGAAGKKAALEAAASSLGGDRKFSHWKRKPALSAGYDTGSTEVTVNMRPAGLWKLAESGRRSSGPIYPRRGRGKGRSTVARRAVMTPDGPRARSSYRPSRGLNTYSEASKKAQATVPKAAHDQFVDEIRRALG